MGKEARVGNLRVEALRTTHNISSFVSSNGELTAYLVEDALKDQENKTAITHLMLTRTNEVVGYFTLVNDSVKVEVMSKEDRLDGYPYKSIPALKIARLSTHREREHEGIGSKMVTIAFSYLFEIVRYAGCRVMTVDSKKGCEGFYQRFGFNITNQTRDDHTPMYLDIGKFITSMES